MMDQIASFEEPATGINPAPVASVTDLYHTLADKEWPLFKPSQWFVQRATEKAGQ